MGSGQGGAGASGAGGAGGGTTGADGVCEGDTNLIPTGGSQAA